MTTERNSEYTEDPEFEQSVTDLLNQTAAKARPTPSARTAVIERAEKSDRRSAVVPRLAQVAAAAVLVGGIGVAVTQGRDSTPDQTVVGTETADAPATTEGSVAETPAPAETAPAAASSQATTAASALPAESPLASPETTITAEAVLIHAVHEFPDDSPNAGFEKYHLYLADGGYRFAEQRENIFRTNAYQNERLLQPQLAILDDDALDTAARRDAMIATLPTVEAELADNRLWVQMLSVLESGLATPDRMQRLAELTSTIADGQAVTSATNQGQRFLFQVTNPLFDGYVESITLTERGVPIEFTGASAAGEVAVTVSYDVEPVADLDEFQAGFASDEVAESADEPADQQLVPSEDWPLVSSSGRLVFAEHEFPSNPDAAGFRKHHIYLANGGYLFAPERAGLTSRTVSVDGGYLTDLLAIIDGDAGAEEQRAAVLDTLPSPTDDNADNRVWTQMLSVLSSGLADADRQAGIAALLNTTATGSVTELPSEDGRRLVAYSTGDGYVETVIIDADDGTPIRFEGGSAGTPDVIVTYTVESFDDLDTFLADIRNGG